MFGCTKQMDCVLENLFIELYFCQVTRLFFFFNKISQKLPIAVWNLSFFAE